MSSTSVKTWQTPWRVADEYSTGWIFLGSRNVVEAFWHLRGHLGEATLLSSRLQMSPKLCALFSDLRHWIGNVQIYGNCNFELKALLNLVPEKYQLQPEAEVHTLICNLNA